MHNQLLSCVELESELTATASVIWLHGLGADGHDFEAVAPSLGLTSRTVRFVFPHAPHRPVTINNGFVMRAWYDIADANLGAQQDEAGIKASALALSALIENEQARGIAADRIVLCGFSQGGAVALYTGLRYPQTLRGLIALSSYLPMPAKLTAEAHPANARIPIFLGHGRQDTLVPIDHAHASCRTLQAQGYTPTLRLYPMPHAVCAEELRDIGICLSEWLA